MAIIELMPMGFCSCIGTNKFIAAFATSQIAVMAALIPVMVALITVLAGLITVLAALITVMAELITTMAALTLSAMGGAKLTRTFF